MNVRFVHSQTLHGEANKTEEPHMAQEPHVADPCTELTVLNIMHQGRRERLKPKRRLKD